MTIDPKYPTDYDKEIDISYFEKSNWKTAEARDLWKEPLAKFKNSYPVVEIKSVASDDTDRQAAIIDRGLLRNADVVNAISDSGLQSSVKHNRAFISGDQSTLDELEQATADDDCKNVGKVLGYPDCCISSFEEVDDLYRPPLYEVACNSGNAVENTNSQDILIEEPNPVTNVFWDFLGWSFISHIPCSFDCEKSIEIGEAHGSIYRDIGLGDEAEKAWEFLSCPLEWSGYHGISKLLNGYLIGSTNSPEYWDKKTVQWRGEHSDKLV